MSYLTASASTDLLVAGAEADAAAAGAGGRLRGLLRNFYGLEGEPDADSDAGNESGESSTHDAPPADASGSAEIGTGTAKGVSSRPAPSISARRVTNVSRANVLDINSGSFDSKTYLDRQLATKNISELILEDTSLVTSIRDLDTSMRTLVYENYTKFISATETLRQMQSSVGNMEEEMTELRNKVHHVSVSADSLEAAVAPAREQVERFSRTAQVLEQVRFLVELPQKLRRCIDLRAFDLAVRYYVGTKPLLHKLGSDQGGMALLPALTTVREECDAAAASLEAELRRSLTGDGLPTPKTANQARQQQSNASDAVQLLLQLGSDSNDLQILFIESRLSRCLNQLQEGARRMSERELSGEGASALSVHDDLAFVLDQTVLQTFVPAVGAFWKLFCVDTNDRLVPVEKLTDFVNRFYLEFADVIAKLLQVFGVHAGGESNGSANQSLSRISHAIRIIIRVASCAELADSQISALTRVRKITKSRRDVNIASVMPVMIEKLMRTLSKATHSCVDAAFSSAVDVWTRQVLRELEQNAVSGPSAPPAAELAALLEATVQRLILEIQRSIEAIRPLLAVSADQDTPEDVLPEILAKQRPGTLTKIDVKVQQLFLSINVSLSQFADVPASKVDQQNETDSRVFLVLSRAASMLGCFGISEIVESLAGLSKEFDETERHGISPDDLQKRFRMSATLLLQTYTRRRALSLSRSLSRAVETLPRGSDADIPVHARTSMLLLVDEIHAVADDLALLLGDGSQSSDPSANKDEIFWSSSSDVIIGSILKHGGCTLREAVRDQVDLTAASISQLQVDAYAFWRALGRKSATERTCAHAETKSFFFAFTKFAADILGLHLLSDAELERIVVV